MLAQSLIDRSRQEGSSLEVNVSFQIIVRLTNWQGSSDTAQAYVHAARWAKVEERRWVTWYGDGAYISYIP